MAPLLRGIFRCWICGRRVALEDCKIDEHGYAVHENCYIGMALRHSRRKESIHVLVEQERRKS
jgi:hypothetical protein